MYSVLFSSINLDLNFIHASITEKQLLLQATHIKNTDWLYGVAVYTGNIILDYNY